jgi:putative Mg2+ transporter-C (MgtC) family protein
MDIEFQLTVLAEIVLAMFLGGVIGLERELVRKPAGLRTHMLAAGSASLFVMLGNSIVAESDFPAFVQADPIRIIQAIIVGISFVGAGTILHRESEGGVEGLTTAASLLASAGIGIAVAMRFFVLSIGVTVLILLVNRLLGMLEAKVLGTNHSDW